MLNFYINRYINIASKSNKRGEDQFDSTYLLFDMNKNIITIKDTIYVATRYKDVLFVMHQKSKITGTKIRYSKL